MSKPVTKPPTITRKGRSATRFKVVDLFCGCGGLSHGLERTGKFSTLLGVDINKAAIETFVKNHGAALPPATFLGDIRTLRPEDIWSALRAFRVTEPGAIDCLVGGPPCEGFSRNKVSKVRAEKADTAKVPPVEYQEQKYWHEAWSGKIDLAEMANLRAYNPFLTDPRNYLFRWFLDIAEILQPKIILIENVIQMLTHANGVIAREITRRLRGLGYVAEARILNAADMVFPN